ncbi:hypothetical protein [Lachnoclostridium sp. An181]|uniref:hypothetical protein n=1 Tax=Lachnoclostridium sp. An181 TaxID=1965575 RepID=UPI000B39B4EF|nr:hypothetical protein [Lachnoclostridium sp. An181]OUP50724.1 hypothetical protein B5F18_03580 [Lachnoclostridium sp. An181]
MSRYQTFIDGNTVRKEWPEGRPNQEQRTVPKKKVSSQVKKNRNKAAHMNKGYVLFLAVAAVMTLFVCVQYIGAQSEMTTHSRTITKLQEELAAVREKNNTAYNAVMNSMNLEEIRKRAQEELGMTNISPEQIVKYQSPADNYIRQYEAIPKSGILAHYAGEAAE